MGSIRLVTDIPGPRSRALAKQASEIAAKPVVPGGEVFISKAEGAVIEDVDGNHFIDFIGGIGCLAVGHSHPRVVSAITEHAASFLHTDFSLIPYESYIELGRRISEASGGGRKVAFFNSGAEAVENAVKVAKGSTGKQGIVCFEGAFHGRTLMALSLTHREVPLKVGFGPFAAEVFRVPYPGVGGASLEDSIAGLNSVFSGNEIGGVIVEPVLGEGGFVVPPTEFLPAVREICSKNGAVFIADEVQSGYGRTGTFLASEHSDVRPDVICLGKSIAAGLPLSAVVGDPEFMDALEPGALGGTYVGNPVACTAGIAVLDVFEKEGLLERAAKIGQVVKTTWEQAANDSAGIAEVRGLGAMIAVEFADHSHAKKLVGAARKRGVLALTAGPQSQAVRHLMPFVITDEQLEEGLSVLVESLSDL